MTRRQKNTLMLFTAGWLILLITLFTAGTIFTLSLIDKERQLESVLARKEALLNHYRVLAMEPNRKKLENEIERLRAEFNSIAVSSEESFNIPFEVRDLTLKGDVRELSVKSVKSKSSKKSDKEVELNFVNVTFNSNFNDFAGTISRYEQSKPLLLTDKFTIKRANNDISNNSVLLNTAFFTVNRKDNSYALKGSKFPR